MTADTKEPWVCVKCGETVVPLDDDEVWHYVVTGESRLSRCPKGKGMAKPHTMARDELVRRYPQRYAPSR